MYELPYFVLDEQIVNKHSLCTVLRVFSVVFYVHVTYT